MPPSRPKSGGGAESLPALCACRWASRMPRTLSRTSSKRSRRLGTDDPPAEASGMAAADQRSRRAFDRQDGMETITHGQSPSTLWGSLHFERRRCVMMNGWGFGGTGAWLMVLLSIVVVLAVIAGVVCLVGGLGGSGTAGGSTLQAGFRESRQYDSSDNGEDDDDRQKDHE